MNYGYAYTEDTDSVILEETNEINRYSIQLYHNLLEKVDYQSKDILEVGSGRGGGSNYISGLLSSGKITGMDLAEDAVEFCERNYHNANLNYVVGNSEDMPFEDESFDIVMNVESSHAYGSVSQFLSEVKRVLRPSGHLLLTDFRDPDGSKLLEQQLSECGMSLISERNITENVLKAIKEEDAIKRSRIQEHIPSRMSKLFSEFAGVTGSKVHEGLLSGSLVYYQFVLQNDQA